MDARSRAQRLVAAHGQDFRHCHPWHKDLVWAGNVWAVDRTAVVERLAKGVIHKLYLEGLNQPDHDKHTALISHALKREDARRIAAGILKNSEDLS